MAPTTRLAAISHCREPGRSRPRPRRLAAPPGNRYVRRGAPSARRAELVRWPGPVVALGAHGPDCTRGTWRPH